VKLLQSAADGVVEQEFQQNFSRRPGREADVEGRLVPDEAPPMLEAEMKRQRRAVEQHHVEAQPAGAEKTGHQVAIEILLGRIAKLAGRARQRPPCLVLLEETVQV